MEAWLVNLFTPYVAWAPELAVVVAAVIKIVAIIVPLLIAVAYLTWLERRVLGAMQVRIGPNRVGPAGLLQPIADGLKLVFKEIVVPSAADKPLFYAAPILAMAPALLVWAVVPFTSYHWFTQINAALIFVLAVSSLGVYGIILAGWASNSKYALMGAMRSAAQIVSYEIAMGFALVCVLLVSDSLNLVDIVASQRQGWFADHGLSFLSWNWLPLLPMFVVYLISGVVETNRAPFDVAEGESEIVAGFHVEYSGTPFAIFFLAEYANMILIAALTSILFLGGWLSPVSILPSGALWLFLKMFFLLFAFIWMRATFPRFRYDQIMRLGWKIFIPLTLLWVVVVAAWRISPWNIWS